MNDIFMKILAMSATASVAIVFVLFLRLFLKPAPRIFCSFLWMTALIRLLCPVLPEAEWGLLPSDGWPYYGKIYIEEPLTESATQIPAESAAKETPSISIASASGRHAEHEREAGTYIPSESPQKSVFLPFNITERTAQRLTIVWFTGFLALLFQGIIGYRHFMRRLKAFSECGEYIVQREIISQAVETPFVAGFFRPIIYLPAGLEEKQMSLVRKHEELHISHRDYLIKPLAYLAVCIHWFNPLVWLMFYLMEHDMEVACDEAVLRKVGYDRRKDYARTLLYLAGEHKWRPGSPIAFGERGVKTRIRKAVRYKGSKRSLAIVDAVVVLAAMAVLLVNGRQGMELSDNEISKDTGSVNAPDKTAPAEEVPGTDVNSETEYIYRDTGSSSSDIVSEETIYQPQEKEEMSDIYSVLLKEEQASSSVNYEGGTVEDKEAAEAAIYISPLSEYRISNDYGSRVHPLSGETLFHSGVDLAAEKDTPIGAAAPGIVLKTGFDTNCGNYVILRHLNGDATYYAHCAEILASEGQTVNAGEPIATVGSSGTSTGPHLHFAQSRDGNYIQPEVSF